MFVGGGGGVKCFVAGLCLRYDLGKEVQNIHSSLVIALF